MAETRETAICERGSDRPTTTPYGSLKTKRRRPWRRTGTGTVETPPAEPANVGQGVGVVVGCVAPMAPTVMKTGTAAEAMAATRTATVRGIVRRAWSMLGSPVWLGSELDGGA